MLHLGERGTEDVREHVRHRLVAVGGNDPGRLDHVEMQLLLETRPTANATADPFQGTDDWTWELGPDPDDARWWAEQNDDYDPAPEPDDAEWDRQGAEYEAADAYQRGLVYA